MGFILFYFFPPHAFACLCARIKNSHLASPCDRSGSDGGGGGGGGGLTSDLFVVRAAARRSVCLPPAQLEKNANCI